MKFKSVFINTDKLYSVGIDEETGKYGMAVVVTWIASYTRYFELTRQEYELHKNDIKKLNDIAESFLKLQKPKDSERFLFSEMKNEN
jgi:hypothetical protein